MTNKLRRNGFPYRCRTAATMLHVPHCMSVRFWAFRCSRPNLTAVALYAKRISFTSLETPILSVVNAVFTVYENKTSVTVANCIFKVRAKRTESKGWKAMGVQGQWKTRTGKKNTCKCENTKAKRRRYIPVLYIALNPLRSAFASNLLIILLHSKQKKVRSFYRFEKQTEREGAKNWNDSVITWSY